MNGETVRALPCSLLAVLSLSLSLSPSSFRGVHGVCLFIAAPRVRLLGTMGPAAHRLPAHLPTERSLEEVILARKMTASAESQFTTSRYDRYTSAGGESGPERGMLASPSSPANFLSHLPPEAYAREVSSRLGKRRRSKAMRRSTPDRRSRSGGGGGFPLSQQQLRPLTGVSPPGTAQHPFTLADYAVDNARPTVSEGGLCTKMLYRAAAALVPLPRQSQESFTRDVE